ncbi:uncharacterized protein PoB_007686600 [Plakobranchus ocellatus]|uniref:EF-hand domain-containing protein n=1 Tax=Plakobranchus ocellatus TaxID=259542 RepID=A0AAV4E1X4_9GAST|nr:uncharacterized protein PoB_007686600 [Plakobranchus ocellatus]
MAEPSSASTKPPEQEEDSVSEELLTQWTKEAESGSINHQFKIACHYLKLAELGVDQENNGKKAVFWFIKASQRGDEAATEKLRHCVLTNLGISESNKSDALWCLNTSASEKRVRHAAKSLFARLNTGQSGVISKAEYIEAINSLTAGHEKERKILLAAGECDC